MNLLLRRAARLACAAAAFALLLPGAVRAGETKPFFFIQLSDPQLGMFTHNADFAQETANLEFAVAAINRLQPAFVVVTGDLINRPADADQLAEYQRIMAKVAPSIPVHQVTGNHDVGSVPTPITVAAWKTHFGEDHYTFQHEGFVGIVLNSSIITAPQKVPEMAAAQEQWLKAELEKARASGAAQIAIFQHHSWFLKSAAEPDQYFNIPLERRAKYLALFHEFSVHHLFCGHYHRNAIARDGDLEVVTTGPVGKPMGDGKSGLRIISVRGASLEHRYFDFGELPTAEDLKKMLAGELPMAKP